METFSTLLVICVGNSLGTGDFPTQRPVTRSFDVCFDLCLNKRLSKQSWGWWFETLSRPLWHQCNVNITDGNDIILTVMYIFNFQGLLTCVPFSWPGLSQSDYLYQYSVQPGHQPSSSPSSWWPFWKWASVAMEIMHLKMSSAKCQPFCLCHNVLNQYLRIQHY